MSDWIDVETEKPANGVEFEGWVVTDDGHGYWEPKCIIDKDRGLGLYGRIDYDTDGFDYGLSHLTLTHWKPQPKPPSNKT